MNDLLKIALLLGIGGVALYLVYYLQQNGSLSGGATDLGDVSDDSETPGGGSSSADPCLYPIVCDASGSPTGQEVPLATGVTT